MVLQHNIIHGHYSCSLIGFIDSLALSLPPLQHVAVLARQDKEEALNYYALGRAFNSSTTRHFIALSCKAHEITSNHPLTLSLQFVVDRLNLFERGGLTTLLGKIKLYVSPASGPRVDDHIRFSNYNTKLKTADTMGSDHGIKKILWLSTEDEETAEAGILTRPPRAI